MTAKPLLTLLILLVALLATRGFSLAGQPQWARKSTITGDLKIPNPGDEQTCNVVADFDGDGIVDFAIGERTRTPSIVWYRWNGAGWDRHVIDDTALKLEAGGAAGDIDGDGDLDLVLGQDASGNQMWWWENPKPNFDQPWKRRLIKNGGAPKHHDQTLGDYDGDGQPELVSWNQGARELLWYEIPGDAKSIGPWQSEVIYRWGEGRECEGFPSKPVDIDGDGLVDLVGGGRWFKHQGGTKFEATLIDDAMRFTQCAAGQLVEGGWAEVVFAPGDMDGTAKWYEWKEGKWVAHDLRHVIHGHSCEVRDIDGDGQLDIMIGEMGNPGAGDNAQTFVWYGNGRGRFRETVTSKGQGVHEGQVADFNGDGRLDILMKPYNHNSPRVDVLLNNSR